MKRLLTVLLTVSLLFGMLCTPVLAHERPAGSSAETPVELTSATEIADLSTNIAKGLTGAPHMSPTMLNASSSWKDESNAIEEAELADIANHFKYGISLLGIRNLERAVTAGVDGIWAKGGWGETNTLHFSTTQAQGALSYTSLGVLYNEKGEATPEGKGVTDGYIYQTIITFNFGKVANLNAFGYAYPNGTAIGFPQAADVYVSDDGINWTLVGYYDRPTKRMNGEDYNMISGHLLGKDGADATMNENTQNYTQFNLPEGTKAQFLRIAATCNGGKTNPSNMSEYDTFSNAYGEQTAFREIFVFGSLTDEVKTPWMAPEDDPYLQATQTTEEVTESEDLPQPKPVETKAPTTTTKPAETDAPATDAPGTQAPDSTDEKKGGCGASVGAFGGIAVILLGSAGAVALMKDKKKKEEN